MPTERKTNFTATCNLLSQYLKEKKGDHIGLVTNTKGKSETPQTMNLLPGFTVDTTVGERTSPPEETRSVRAPKHGGGDASQMTIFYAGHVIVIDDFTEEKATGLMEIVGRVAASSAVGPQNPPHPGHLATSSDLPIARRASLGRFLERRKQRVVSKGPYEASCSSAPRAELVKPDPWLALAPTSDQVAELQ